jgi:hypothetical protein
MADRRPAIGALIDGFWRQAANASRGLGPLKVVTSILEKFTASSLGCGGWNNWSKETPAAYCSG